MICIKDLAGPPFHKIFLKQYFLIKARSDACVPDTKGRITYVNPTFIEVSGFSDEELIGKAHNIVRHPDMPPAAFADLWQTLQAGEPWTGLVKNRRKNGDFYWVVANVVPIKEEGATCRGHPRGDATTRWAACCSRCAS